MKYFSSNNQEKRSRERKVDLGNVLTIPNQTLSIKELFYRYSQGLTLDPMRNEGTYDDLTIDDDLDVTENPINGYFDAMDEQRNLNDFIQSRQQTSQTTQQTERSEVKQVDEEPVAETKNKTDV